MPRGNNTIALENLWKVASPVYLEPSLTVDPLDIGREFSQERVWLA
jgi:hypothetical protein